MVLEILAFEKRYGRVGPVRQLVCLQIEFYPLRSDRNKLLCSSYIVSHERERGVQWEDK